MLCKKLMRFWFGIIFSILLVVFSPVFAAPSSFIETGMDTFEFTYEFIIKNTGSIEVHSLQGEIPVMAWDGLPSYQQVISVISDPPVVWNENGYSVSFTLRSLPPHQSFRMNVNYKIALTECFQDPPNQPADLGYAGHDMATYLRAENGIEVGHPQIVEVLNKLGLRSDTPKEKARKIFAFVTDTLDYRMDLSRKADALKALQTGWGRCEDYAMLFVALCRTTGIPARVASGFRIDRNELRGSPMVLNDAGHAWAEAYLPFVGWISVDPTYIALNKGEKIIDYRNFAGFYPDDIHIFTHYGEPETKVFYEYDKRSRANVKLEDEVNYYLSRTL